MDTIEILELLSDEIERSEGSRESGDAKSWDYQKGILISRDEAREIRAAIMRIPTKKHDWAMELDEMRLMSANFNHPTEQNPTPRRNEFYFRGIAKTGEEVSINIKTYDKDIWQKKSLSVEVKKI